MKFTQKDIYNYTITVARMIIIGGDYKKYLETLHEDERAAVLAKLKIIAKEIYWMDWIFNGHERYNVLNR